MNKIFLQGGFLIHLSLSTTSISQQQQRQQQQLQEQKHGRQEN
jgi:hypothetical protein